MRRRSGAEAHPRSRGENVVPKVKAVAEVGSSPLTRGKLAREGDTLSHQRLIPAHAGKTFAASANTERTAAHPRSRGENRRSDHWDPGTSGSSPLTRGKRRELAYRSDSEGLIPAHAGKTDPTDPQHPLAWAHPRSRGENLSALIDGSGQKGSSPLTRGKRSRANFFRPVRGLIPAHAGKTDQESPQRAIRGAHPRSRGENPARSRLRSRVAGSSPLTRGKPGHIRCGRSRAGLIPAHAGKTYRAIPGRFSGRAHPRSRGENEESTSRASRSTGSSPLTRGKRRRNACSCSFLGLIPAHAGKTCS